jgi:hypothetical protein
LGHDACIEVGAKELEHLLVFHRAGDSGQKGIVVHSVEEGLQIEIDHPPVSLGHGFLGSAHGLVGRAAGPKAVASVREVGVEDGGEHLEEGLLDESVQYRGHPEVTHPAGGFGDRDPADGAWSVGARVEFLPDLRPVGMEPGPKFLGGHAVRTGGTGVLLDALERPGEVLFREEALEETCRGGVRVIHLLRRGEALLLTGAFRLHPIPTRQGPFLGLAAFIVSPCEPEEISLALVRSALPGFSSSSPPVLWPRLTSPWVRRNLAAPTVHSPPGEHLFGDRASFETPKETSPDKSNRLPPTAAAST